jgi:hypothetical protein
MNTISLDNRKRSETEMRKNCWEVTQCGREPGGKGVELLGVCPAAMKEESDGINHGRAAGRLCWSVEGTLSTGAIGVKFMKCLKCSFFQTVESQEGRFFVLGVGSRNRSNKYS